MEAAGAPTKRGRHALIAAAGILLGLAACAFVGVTLFGSVFIPSPDDGVDVEVRITNRTDRQVGPFEVFAEYGKTTLPVRPVPAGDAVTVRFLDPSVASENSLLLRDSEGRVYALVGYFESPLGGRVDVSFTQQTDSGLRGRVRELTSYFGSPTWNGLVQPEGSWKRP